MYALRCNDTSIKLTTTTKSSRAPQPSARPLSPYCVPGTAVSMAAGKTEDILSSRGTGEMQGDITAANVTGSDAAAQLKAAQGTETQLTLGLLEPCVLPLFPPPGLPLRPFSSDPGGDRLWERGPCRSCPSRRR